MHSSNNIRQFKKRPIKKTPQNQSRSKAKSPLGIILVIIVSLSLILAFREMLRSRNPISDSSTEKSLQDQMTSSTSTNIIKPAADPTLSLSSSITGKSIRYGDSIDPQKREDIWVLYNLLSDEDKNIYNLFLDLVEHRNVIGYANGITISEREISQIGEDHFWCIYHTMLSDHPEYFFLYSNSDTIDCHYSTTASYRTYVFSISPDSEMIARQIEAFDVATKSFMKDIDTSLPIEELELAIHDKLISLVSYDYDLFEKSKTQESVSDLGYTAYGALVSNSEGRTNKAVCNGYSFAFEYLCQKANIPCGIISGEAYHIPDSPDQDQRDHAWNVVYVNGKWYEVDTTWDDFEYMESLRQADPQKYFNRLHHYYNRTTAEMNFLKATDDTLFQIEGYQPYNAVTDSIHIRTINLTGTSDDITVFRNRLIPMAE